MFDMSFFRGILQQRVQAFAEARGISGVALDIVTVRGGRIQVQEVRTSPQEIPTGLTILTVADAMIFVPFAEMAMVEIRKKPEGQLGFQVPPESESPAA